MAIPRSFPDIRLLPTHARAAHATQALGTGAHSPGSNNIAKDVLKLPQPPHGGLLPFLTPTNAKAVGVTHSHKMQLRSSKRYAATSAENCEKCRYKCRNALRLKCNILPGSAGDLARSFPTCRSAEMQKGWARSPALPGKEKTFPSARAHAQAGDPRRPIHLAMSGDPIAQARYCVYIAI